MSIAMSNFTHSVVLFTGEDGLPLEFNIQHCVDKQILNKMIEYGGGLSTYTDNAIYLVTPGTKVLNIDSRKKIVSSRYIFDCVRENYLLDTEDYKIEINEVETSDLSEENTLNIDINEPMDEGNISDNSVDIINPNKTVSPHLLHFPSSNHDFDFEESENRNIKGLEKEVNPQQRPTVIAQEVSMQNVLSENRQKHSDNCTNTVPDSLDLSGNGEPNALVEQVSAIQSDMPKVNNNTNSDVREESIHAVIVSSSQPNELVLDGFDNIVLKKLKEKPAEQQDDDSQSYTVSSSADAQVSPKLSPPHNTSAEIFSGSSAIPDSASQNAERQKYITDLEKEIKEILKKPSPRSIQDKTVLVKYICCVKKLAPAIVLQTLQSF